MSLVNTLTPTRDFSFDNTTTDSVAGINGTTAGTIAYVTGQYGQGIYITNPAGATSANFVSYNDANLTNLLNVGTNGASISVWINVGILDGSIQYYLQIGSLCFLQIIASNFLGFLYIAPSTAQYSVNTIVPPLNTWIHVVCTIGGNLLTMYVNGVRYGPTSAPTAGYVLGSANPTYRVGGALASGNLSQARSIRGGSVDELRIYNTVLNISQVQAIYNSSTIPLQITGPTCVLTGVSSPRPTLLWSFNGSNVDSINNLSPSFSSINGATTYAPTYLAGLYGRQAIYFNNSTFVSTANCSVRYSLSTYNLTSNNLTFTVWTNFSAIPASFGLQYAIQMSDSGNYILQVPSNTIQVVAQAIIISGPVISAGSWVHSAVILSNVGMTSSNTSVTYLVNGIVRGTTSNVVRSDTINIGNMYISISNGGNRPMWGLMQDLRIFNTALTPAQILSIYNESGSPMALQASLVGTPLFSQISSAAASSAVGAFSLRAVNGVTAKAVNIRRGSDNATQDFYADRLGNLLTAPVIGQTLASWLGNPYYTYDSSTTPLTVTYSGTAGPQGTVSSVYEYSANFPGVKGSYLTIADQRFGSNTWWTNGGFTFEAWVNYASFTNATGSTSFPISFGTMAVINSGVNGPNWTFGANASGLLTFYYYTTGQVLVTAASGTMSTGTWYHTCVQCDGTNIYLYVNGVQVKSQALLLTPQQSAGVNFSIGQWNSSTTNPNFSIGDVRLVYNANVYVTSGFTVPSAPLTPYSTGGAVTALLLRTVPTGYVSTWYDQSGAGNHASQPTQSCQPQVNLTTSPYSLIFNGSTTNLFSSNFTFNFGTNYQFGVRAVVNNTSGGCLLYKGSVGAPWYGGQKKWWLGSQNGSESSIGGYPNQVGNSEGYIFGQTAISAAKSSVTWSVTGYSPTDTSLVSLYENASLITPTYSGRSTQKLDQGNYLYIGTGGAATNYGGNIYEIEIFSNSISASDVIIMG